MYYFTADEHYYHENIIKYCNRPFKNVEQMNEELVRKHNEIVGQEDIVIHAGDFTMKSKEWADKIISRLNGQPIFLKGSHDNWNKELPYIWEGKIETIYVVVCHYAMLTWSRSHYDSIQLFGHSHGKLNVIGKQMDIGVDCNNFHPFSFKQIVNRLCNSK